MQSLSFIYPLLLRRRKAVQVFIRRSVLVLILVFNPSLLATDRLCTVNWKSPSVASLFLKAQHSSVY